MIVSEELLLLWHKQGVEDSLNCLELRDWFPTSIEKYAYILGYTDKERGEIKDKEEVLELINKLKS